MTKVRIRTYRQGLGDCFLLTFTGDDNTEVHVLIDCGVLIGTANASVVMKDVLADISRTTGGKLDIVVATHEHWDHVSGFNQARDEFDTLQMDRIWMAWTEDPEDELATELRQEREERKRSLTAAFQLWDSQVKEKQFQATASTQGRVAATRQVLEFFGELGAHDGRRKTSDAMEYLRQHAAPKQYLLPGMVQTLPGLLDVRAYVLGPPRDLKWLKKDRPSSSNPETYTGGDHALTMSESFFTAVNGRSTANERDERAFPFEKFYRKSEFDPVVDTFFNDNYRNREEWRQVDYDWLGSTGDLALALDSDTNNTSLVLAFELGESGDFLLFPADAQVGNWLSWRDVTWESSPNLSIDDLLERTVFYKVAHHGSHNATLREMGLEKMTHSQLTAMIPVDAATAEKQRWAMPFDPLWQRLHEKCQGRVLRSDQSEPDGRRLRRLSEDDRNAFHAMITQATDLFIDLEIET